MDPLVITIAIVFIIVATLAVSVSSTKVPPKNKHPKTRTITINNGSTQDTVIVINGTPQKVIMPFNSTQDFTIPGDALVKIEAVSPVTILPKAAGFSGTAAVRTFNPPHKGLYMGGHLLKDEVKTIVVKPDDPNTFYVTESSITPETQVKKGVLINDSQSPVEFIEMGVEDRRWPKEISPPVTRQPSIITAGSRWEVINPAEQFMVLGSITAPEGTTVLRWDGTNLTAEQ